MILGYSQFFSPSPHFSLARNLAIVEIIIWNCRACNILYRQVATSIPWSIQQFQFCSGWSLWHYWLLQPVTSSKVNVWCEKMVFKVHATSQWNSEFTDSCTIMFSRPCGGGADGHYWILVFILSMLYWDMAYIFYNLLCAAIFKSPWYKTLVQLKLAQ